MNKIELRIGNIVHIGGLDTQIAEIFDDGITTTLNGHQYEYMYHFIEPIELTESWLLKFGFYYIDDDDEFLARPVLIEALKLNSDSSDFFKTCSLRIHKNLTIEVRYVHRLQNLYFELTGEELNIE
ncbi:MAG: hypothetical protein WC389_22790 [Lutibacter sp.]|jgi:hypothetical protein